MLNKRELTKQFVKLISDEILNGIDIQIINGYDLLKIPEKALKYPRLIVDMVGYDDSNYDYMDQTYNKNEDVIDINVLKIPELTYRFRVYNDSKNNIDMLDVISKLHFYFANPYRYIFQGNMQIIRVGMIVDVSSGVDEDYVVGYQFTMDFIMEEKDTLKIDYADKFNFETTIKN